MPRRLHTVLGLAAALVPLVDRPRPAPTRVTAAHDAPATGSGRWQVETVESTVPDPEVRRRLWWQVSVGALVLVVSVVVGAGASRVRHADARPARRRGRAAAAAEEGSA